ncbi:ATP-binding protein [Catenulispora yoronensis]
MEGMGGIGKTQLAVHAAHTLVRSGRYAELQLYVNLRGFDPERPPADPAAVLESFLRRLGVAAQHVPDSLDERAAMFRDRMHGRDALVVLDNAADEKQVRDLIPASPGCLVLVTSRRSMSGIDDAMVFQLELLGPAESAGLIARIAGPERAAADPGATRRVADLCGGLPLAVVLAAARLRSPPAWTMRDLADRLEHGIGELADGELNLAAVFELSYSGLPQAAQTVFRLMGIDPGLDATAESVAALAGIPAYEARRILELLQDEHLVRQQVPDRYELHDLLRAFAIDKCHAVDPAADREAAVDRWLDWTLQSVYTAMDQLQRLVFRVDPLPCPPGIEPAAFADEDEARAWVAAERANLVAATRHAAAHRPGHAWRICQALARYYLFSGYNSEWADQLRHAIPAAEAEGNAAALGELWHSQGTFEGVAGFFDRALIAFGKAVPHRELAGDRSRTAITLGNLACVHLDLGHYRQATAAFRRSLVLLRETGHHVGEASMVHNMGVVLAATGRHRQAVETLTEAHDLYRKHGEEDDPMVALAALGQSLGLLGEHERAQATVAEAVASAERVGSSRRLGARLNILGTLATQRGDYEEAERSHQRARQIAHEISDRGEETEALYRLGVNALRSGEPKAALEFLELADGPMQGQSRHRWVLPLAQARGDALLALGAVEAADQQFELVLADEERSEAVVIGSAAYGKARLALAQQPPDRDAARRWLREALRVLSEAELPSLEHEITAALAEVEAQLG